MYRAGVVNFLPGKIDQTQGSEVICIPGIEGHMFHILLQLSIEFLFGNDEGGERDGRRIRFFPFDISVLDRRSFLIHEKLDAKIEPDLVFSQGFSQFFPEIIFTLWNALPNGPQHLRELPSGRPGF